MANLISLGRLCLLFVGIAFIFTHSFPLTLAAIGIIAIVFASDGIDGFVARRRGSTSELGAILDIAGDRVVENGLWITFAVAGVIGVWAPLVVMTRGFLVDAMRGVTYAQGKSAFGENTMMRSSLTRFLAASRFMRLVFGAAKGFGFLFLTGLVASHLGDAGSGWIDLYRNEPFRIAGWVLVYLAIALTIIRGLPVIVDALAYMQKNEGMPE